MKLKNNFNCWYFLITFTHSLKDFLNILLAHFRALVNIWKRDKFHFWWVALSYTWVWISELKFNYCKLYNIYIFTIYFSWTLLCHFLSFYIQMILLKEKKNRLTWIVTQNYTHMPILPYFFARNLIHFTYFLELWHFLGSGWANIIFFWTESCSTNLLWFWVLHSLHTSAHYLVKGTAIILKPTSFYRETLTKLMAT